MRSVPSDFTARATIRNAALALFAEHGPDAVTIRQVAAAAHVSPGLVMHHFGTKAGLREAVDAHVADVFFQLFDTGDDSVWPDLLAGDGGSIAQLFARTFPPDSPLPAYLRRLLLSGDPAGRRLFQSWYDATLALFSQLGAAGLVDAGDDAPVRSAFALVNDLALVLLRDHIAAAIGFDPLTPDGIGRWAREVTTVYRDGLWGRPEPGSHPASSDDDHHSDSPSAEGERS